MSDSGDDDSGNNILSFDEGRERLRKTPAKNDTEAIGSDSGWNEHRKYVQSRQQVPPSSTGTCAAVLNLIAASLPFFFALFFPSKSIHAPSPSLYVTDPMHRQTVLLPSGSTIDLDAGSSLELILKPTGPDVRVLLGQTIFHIRDDSRQRWAVWAGPNRIDDFGTVFAVHRNSADTQITVADGRVAVRLPNIATTTCGSDPELAARGQVHIHESPGGSVVRCEVLSPRQLSDLLGWRSGQVSFADESLRELAEDMGRYNGVTFNTSDPAIAGLRVGGTLRTTNLASFLDLIWNDFGIQAVSRVDKLGERVITLTVTRGRGKASGSMTLRELTPHTAKRNDDQ